MVDKVFMDYKIILSILGSIVGIVAYIPYLFDIFKCETKPHMFSWLIWTVLTFSVAVIQFAEGGGVGVIPVAVNCLICLTLTILSILKGTRDIKFVDYVCLAGALGGLILWYFTGDALKAMLLIILVDIFAFAPTFRKSYNKPFEETAKTYCITAVAYTLGLFALREMTLASVLYPLMVVATNFTFVTMLLIRRKSTI